MRKFQTLSLLIILLFCLLGCSRTQTTVIEGERMTIAYRIIIGRPLSMSEKTKLKHEIHNIFDHINRVFNHWNPDSEISKINAAKKLTPVPVSQQLLSFLLEVEQIVQITEGRFDPTIGRLKSLWLSYLKCHQVPPDHVWAEYYLQSGWKHIHIDKQKQTITKQYDDIQLDLCGIAKGHAVDLLVDACRSLCADVYVDWGGEIKTAGKHPSGRTWNVASTSSPKIFHLSETAIATSGCYHQAWHVEGKTFTHIIDPFTGQPLESLQYPIFSVSVVHSSCMKADALATALMTFSCKQDAEAWAKQHNIEAYIKDTAVS